VPKYNLTLGELIVALGELIFVALLGLLSLLVSLGSLICCILVLIELFKAKGILWGILGIITCGIYAFIWGWMNAGRYNIRIILIAWTACIVIGFVVGLGFGLLLTPPTAVPQY